MTARHSPATAEVVRATTAVGEHYYAAASAVGLTVQEARLLFILTQNPRNMLGLTSALRVPKSTMTGLVARMESAGLVERTPDPQDRRHLLTTPTPTGIAVATEFAADLATRVSGVLSGLDATERDELAGLLSGVLSGIEPA